jgi:hypothetical protein
VNNFALKPLDKPLIDESLRKMSRMEIRKVLSADLSLIINDMTEEKGYSLPEPLDLIIAARDIKYHVVSQVEQRWGVDVPSVELRKMDYPKVILEWYLNKIESEKPMKSYKVPENVKNLINKNELERIQALDAKKFKLIHK